MTGVDGLFLAASVVAALSSFLAVTRRNAVYSAAWMMASLFAVAAIFLLLHSTFLFVVQVLLYAGAILVLFVFVIMLLNPTPQELEIDRPPGWQRALAFAFAAVLLAILGGAVYTSEVAAVPAFSAPGAAVPEPPAFGDTRWFGDTIYVQYAVAFELISLLVLAAIAAAVLLAKRRLAPEEGAPAAAEPKPGAEVGALRAAGAP